MMITATMRDLSSSMSSSGQYYFLTSSALVTEPAPESKLTSGFVTPGTVVTGAMKAVPTTQSSQFLIPLSQSFAFYFSALSLSASVGFSPKTNSTGKVRHHPLGVVSETALKELLGIKAHSSSWVKHVDALPSTAAV